MNDSQDVGQQAAEQMGNIAKSAAKNKHLRRLGVKALKALAKLAYGIIKTIITKVISALVTFLGPEVLAVIIAIIILLIALDAIKDKFDWSSEGNSRTQGEVLFDQTLQDYFVKKHNEITAPLANELKAPAGYGVSVNQNWINTLVSNLTPTYALTAASYFNHVQLDGDNWHKKYKNISTGASNGPPTTISGNDANFTSQPYYTDATSINSRLKGVAAGKANVYISAGQKYGINPAFVASVSMLESGNGSSSLAINQHNIGGMSCASSNPLVSGCYTSSSGRSWSVYSSVDKSIEHITQIMKKNCADRGATTVYACWMIYSPPSDGNAHWGPDVIGIMKKMTTSGALFTNNASMPVGGGTSSGSAPADMQKDIADTFAYYFNDAVMDMEETYTTESGETKTTKTDKSCKVQEQVPKTTTKQVPVTTTKQVPKTVTKQVPKTITKQVPVWFIDESGHPIRRFETVTETTYETVTETVYETVTETTYKTVTETTNETQTKTVNSTEGPTTTKLPARKIPISATAMYKSVTIPYKYVTTAYKQVSVTSTHNVNGTKTEDCTSTKYEKYKIKVPDDTKKVNVTQDGSQIIGFLTSFMPEGAKTKRVRSQDVETMIELMKSLDPNFPPIDSKLVKTGTFNIGEPSFTVPISAGTFTAPTVGPVTSEFGHRTPSGVVTALHYGIDIGGAGRSNVPVVAAADGKVTRAHFTPSYGNGIYILHNVNGKPILTIYAHLASMAVSEGDTVKKGQLIGIMGSTGDSTGMHLHFEVHQSATWNRAYAINPRLIVNFP